jgi:hypothetical protein
MHRSQAPKPSRHAHVSALHGVDAVYPAMIDSVRFAGMHNKCATRKFNKTQIRGANVERSNADLVPSVGNHVWYAVEVEARAREVKRRAVEVNARAAVVKRRAVEVKARPVGEERAAPGTSLWSSGESLARPTSRLAWRERNLGAGGRSLCRPSGSW